MKTVKEIPVQVPKPEVAEAQAEAAGEEGEEKKRSLRRSRLKSQA